MKTLIAIYLIVLIALLAVCDNGYSKKYYVPLKTVCSASFMLIVLIAAMKDVAKGDWYGRALIVPLSFCFIGDVFMGLYNQKRNKNHLLWGIIAFMSAHVVFLAALHIMHPIEDIWLVIGALTMVLIMVAILKLSHLHLGKMVYISLVYCFMVSLMCAKSIQFGFTGGKATMALVGGILFLSSDFSILYLYFYHFKNKRLKQRVHWFNLISYYIGILFFCLSI